MLQHLGRNWRIVPFALTLLWLTTLREGPIGTVQAADTSDAVADQWLAITDVVLAKHVDPPTRQEMLKAAIQSAHQLALKDSPVGLAARLSELHAKEALRAFLSSTISALAEVGISDDTLRAAGVDGMLNRVAGLPITGPPARMAGRQVLIPLEELRVQQQLRDNQYVGIGIQLGMKDEYPTMVKAFPRGPAWLAGGRDGDQMVNIDGFDAKNMPLARVIELLRGQEGKSTTVIVRRADAEGSRKLKMVRGVVPFDTIQGTAYDDAQNWEYQLKNDPRISYLKLESIRGSTPAELRRIAGRLHADDCQALILDLRGAQSGELRYAVMVADLLLGKAPIGQVFGARGRQEFDSSADQLFPGWPMAVLINGNTVGQAEWIAAALQDNGRATLIGQATAGQGIVYELVELPGGIGGVRMNTGKLFRGDGQPLTRLAVANSKRPIPMRRGPNGILMPLSRPQGLRPDHEVAAAETMSTAVAYLQKIGEASSATEASSPTAAGAGTP